MISPLARRAVLIGQSCKAACPLTRNRGFMIRTGNLASAEESGVKVARSLGADGTDTLAC